MRFFTRENLLAMKSAEVHIVGIAGAEGFAVFQYLSQLGFTNLVGHDLHGGDTMRKGFMNSHVAIDKKERTELFCTLTESPISLRTGADYLSGIQRADLVFATQNWFAHKANKPLKLARESGIPVHFLTQLYFDLSPAPIVAITGTNGKTTVTSCLYHILKNSSIPCLMGGNDRHHAQVLNQLDSLPSDGVLVLEVSNRQLLELHTGPSISVLTCIQADHVDEHGSFVDYLNTKLKLIKLTGTDGWAILNRDDPYFINALESASCNIATFGAGLPEEIEQSGISNGQLSHHGQSGVMAIVGKDELQIPGDHNRMNCLAAATAAIKLGVPINVIREGLKSFEAVRHRLQLVAEVKGSRFYDDIASTNPDATVAALNSMRQKVILICGGTVKGNTTDYQKLAPALASKAANVLALPGKASDLVESVAGPVPVLRCKDLQEAMKAVQKLMTPSMDVLLSPAGAGFQSMFNSGPKGFRKLIRGLGKPPGTNAGKPDLNTLEVIRKQLAVTELDQRVFPEAGSCMIKHEYQNETGSHKDRAALYQVTKAMTENAPAVVIPSSGNAAIAVAAAGAKTGMPVYAFLSPGTHPGKIQAMIKFKPGLIIVDKPINRARNISRRLGFQNLRPSRDPRAIEGFMSLGFEIAEQDSDQAITDVFMFSTSGATLLGLFEAFRHLIRSKKRKRLPRLHAVQAGKAIELAQHFDKRPVPGYEDKSSQQAGFGGVRSSSLVPRLLQSIETSGGSAWHITQHETNMARKWLEDQSIHTSDEGCSALAAVARWRQEGHNGTPLVILSGKFYSERDSVFEYGLISGITSSEDLVGETFQGLLCRSNSYAGVEAFVKSMQERRNGTKN